MPDPFRPPDPTAPRHRRVLVQLLVATVALGALVTAHPAAGQDDIVMTGSASVTWVIPAAEIVASTEQGAPIGVNCVVSTVFVLENPPRFEFVDGSTERACGFARYTFEPPPDAKRFAVRFNSDRTVSNQPVHVFQELQFATDPEGNILSSFSYYDSASFTHPPQNFTHFFSIPAGAGAFNLNWTFEDTGTELSGIPGTKFSASQFNATVSRPELDFDDIPLAPGRATDSYTSVTNATRTTITNATINIPDFLQSGNDRAEVEIDLLTSDRLVEIQSPQGVPLNLETVESLASGTKVTIVLDTDILRNVGPGEYKFTFQRTETLPPPAALPPPATIFPLVYLLSLLPAPTAAYAYTQVWRVRRFSEGALSRAGGLYIGAAALTLAYAGLLGFLYFTGNLRQVATLPVGTEGIFVFTGFIVLAIAFVLLGALVARSVLHSLKRDLDERRRIQKELERSNQELEHFAYVASHDLQEPLRTISGFSQLLKKRYEGELDERAVRYITRTVEGTDRMSRLIHDLLEYSRVDSRGRPLEPTDLNKLVDEVKQDLDSLIATSGAKITADHLPTVQADRTQLAQVLSNLVRNSIKYRHPDRTPEVHVSSSQQDGAWMIAVADNGMGIPEDQQERAFVIFQRLVPRETDDTGTGLGLAISRKIVERHAGQIWVESDGASGSTFRFTLPRDPSTMVNGAGPKPKRRMGARRQRGNRAPA